MLAFGMSYLKPYLETVNFREAVCNATTVSIPTPEQYLPCRCYDDDKRCDGGHYYDNYGSKMDARHDGLGVRKSESNNEFCYDRCESGACYSCFPCIRIVVSYVSKDNKVRGIGATLYKSRNMILEDLLDRKVRNTSN